MSKKLNFDVKDIRNFTKLKKPLKSKKIKANLSVLKFKDLLQKQEKKTRKKIRHLDDPTRQMLMMLDQTEKRRIKIEEPYKQQFLENPKDKKLLNYYMEDTKNLRLEADQLFKDLKESYNEEKKKRPINEESLMELEEVMDHPYFANINKKLTDTKEPLIKGDEKKIEKLFKFHKAIKILKNKSKRTDNRLEKNIKDLKKEFNNNENNRLLPPDIRAKALKKEIDSLKSGVQRRAYPALIEQEREKLAKKSKGVEHLLTSDYFKFLERKRKEEKSKDKDNTINYYKKLIENSKNEKELRKNQKLLDKFINKKDIGFT